MHRLTAVKAVQPVTHCAEGNGVQCQASEVVRDIDAC